MVLPDDGGGGGSGTPTNYGLGASYPTGGIYLDPQTYGHSSSITAVLAMSNSGYVFGFDPKTGKLKVYQQSGSTTGPLTEVPDATDLSSVTVNLLTWGT